MGHQQDVICEQCGHHFTASVGGGFAFHLLHCDACGREKGISFDEIEELHRRYMLDGADPDRIDSDVYYEQVEAFAGSCDCGGRFTFEAPPRCPKCRSEKYRPGADGTEVLYD